MSLIDAGYTDEWILQMLKDHNPRFVKNYAKNKVAKIRSEHISGGKGFLSLVFRVFVDFENPSSYSFIMKVPSLKTMDDACDKTEMDPIEKKNFHNALVHSHNVECDMYELLKEIRDFPLAEVYYIQHNTGNSNGLLVMEDLCDRTESLALNTSPTSAHCFNIARHVAQFQVSLRLRISTLIVQDYVNSLPEKKWKNKFSNRVNFHLDRGNVDQWEKYFKKLSEIEPMSLCRLCIEIFGFDSKTLWHGDMWVNNIRMKINDDGSTSSEIAAILDWQIVCEGSPLFDIARFLIYCVDAEIRREIEYQVVDCYYDKLNEMQQDRGSSMSFTREQAYEMYDLASIHQTYEFVYFSYFICAQDREHGDLIHEARAAKLLLRCLFAASDSARRLEARCLTTKFKDKN
ncbi:hypothetical protein M3Y98_00910900 [Aphelenchoides besseyi]|nr:hypothetical protein M3Y98_00910900 [Aphelenchoides besseyi]